MDDLTPLQRDILDFETRTFRVAGAKEQAIAEVFGLGATNYYQQLNAMLESQAALAHNPTLVNRLLRQRRRNQHEQGQHGFECRGLPRSSNSTKRT